mmetsp:Transcript_69065/g.218444  ORF Transcript_69065/g.218444 Transcript_69065/m.218444 type:complete len:1084 (+) Transcript_69065:53-3304(+)
MGDNKRPGGYGGPPAKRPNFGGEDFFDEEDIEEDNTYEEDMMAMAEMQGGVDEDVIMRQKWQRPPLKALDAQKDSVAFQQLDIDYVIGSNHKEFFPQSAGKAPTIRMFGVNQDGNSVCALIHGFEPYFYINMPDGFSPDDVDAFRKILNDRMGEQNKGRPEPEYIVRIEIERKQTVMCYQQEADRPFLKIVTALPTMVTTCRTIMERGVNVPGFQRPMNFTTYESTVLYVLRFMIDCAIVGGNWVEVPAGAYRLRPEASHVSTCQLEFDVHYNSLISHAPEGEWSKLAPVRILSLDIECAGRKGHFPEPEHDPVIQIANMLTIQGQAKPKVKNVMTLGTCAPIVGAEVMPFKDEKDLLKTWQQFLMQTDPDVIIGYNIVNFDLPYLINRAEKLKVGSFPFWGRVRHGRLKMKDTTFSSKAYGTRESKEITIEGRVQFDLLQAIQRDHKLSSYSLNAVSAHFLGEQKEDVHHSCISDLQNGNEETRRRLAVYCLKDAYLPQRLLDKLMFMYNYIEMARVTGVPVSYLLSRGQSIKVFSQILRKCRAKNLLVPNLKVQGQTDGVAYEGATVLDAKQGFYEKPVATLDFASLYPSIMMAHNLCYSTLVPRGMAGQLPADQVTKSPTGDIFVRASVKKGILPEILEELLGARKRAKADIKKATDPLQKAVLDGRQLALKVSANSVYGFTGATVGKLPCLEISSSVTSFGREMIEHTKKMVEAHYTTEKGYSHTADVIYGDTDSVMVNFGVEDTAEAMRLGQEAADIISATFPKPIKLEFEKVYHPYLLINKKRYAGLLWTNPDKYDKMDSKGIETVRRDNCLLVKNVVTMSLHKMLVERDKQGAIDYVKNTIRDLLMNRLDLSLLVITKGLTQEAEAYDNKQAHAELAKKMRVRDPATAPSVGDRVPYVIVKGPKGAKAFEKAEDPIYALENNIPIDFQHYLEHHLSLPLMRIFEPIISNPKQLLSGDHTRQISNPTPSAALGGIMKFAKVSKQCLGCKATMQNSVLGSLCKHCKPREGELYAKSLRAVNELEDLFSRLWTQCQRCQGSLHQDVLCTSRDCPIFYRRKKVQKDLEGATTTLAKYVDW